MSIFGIGLPGQWRHNIALLSALIFRFWSHQGVSPIPISNNLAFCLCVCALIWLKSICWRVGRKVWRIEMNHYRESGCWCCSSKQTTIIILFQHANDTKRATEQQPNGHKLCRFGLIFYLLTTTNSWNRSAKAKHHPKRAVNPANLVQLPFQFGEFTKMVWAKCFFFVG